ncbi:MAG TPA: hypothetical protein DCY13_13930 [Verrucomicrobiales bacterium]|nr:hypothetical protein [Verrucomicrobiales bacterium]
MGTFHVICRSLFGIESDHAEAETWCIDGAAMQVIVGLFCIRGVMPDESTPLIYQEWSQLLRQQRFACGLNWLRLFYQRNHDQSSVVEVLLNNELWLGMENQVRTLPWPATSTSYSLRQFLMVNAG